MINLQALKSNVDLEIANSKAESKDTFRCTIGLAELVSEGLSQAIPTADAVAVVRCKDCKHSGKYKNWNNKEYLGCTWGYTTVVEPNHYCSHGERREERGMSKARICDRCKKVLECNPSAKIEVDYGYYGIMKYELCEDCKKALVRWLDKEGNKDENIQQISP